MLYQWQIADYENLVNSFKNTKPNAILITGGVNSGQNELVTELEKYILCTKPENGLACGECNSCILLREHNHPDIYTLEAEESEERKNSWIKVEQIRAVIEFAYRSNHISPYKLVIIPKAQELNVNSANALLKILEEPPRNCVFILQAASLNQLLPTIKSRCFKYQLALPTKEQALPLVNIATNREFWLTYFNGEPFFDVPFSDAQLTCLIATLSKPSVDNIFIASKDLDPKKVGMGALVEFMLNWLHDLISIASNIPATYFIAQQEQLASLAPRLNLENAFILQDELIFLSEWSNHPLNYKLQFENILFRYQQLYV